MTIIWNTLNLIIMDQAELNFLEIEEVCGEKKI